jgi:hypothetical protein
MIRKDSVSKKHQRNEEAVEDIYGVHFKYQDLFSRLLKVQKQRRNSEIRSSVIRLPSFDAVNLRKNSSIGSKNQIALPKRPENLSTGKGKQNPRSSSAKKVSARQPQTERKLNIFKSFSPLQKTKKKSAQIKISKKKLEKKNPVQSKPSKKQVLKPRNV